MTLPPQRPIRIVDRHPWRRRGAKDAALERVGAAAEPPLAARGGGASEGADDAPSCDTECGMGPRRLLPKRYLRGLGVGMDGFISFRRQWTPGRSPAGGDKGGDKNSLLGSTTTGVSQLARLGPNFGVKRPPGYGSKAEKQTNRLLQSGGNFI